MPPSVEILPYRLLSSLSLASSLLLASLSAQEPFTDIAGEAGVDLVHVNGAKGLKLLHETMSGAGGWLDFDQDGDLDIYIVQGHGDSKGARSPGAESNRLFRNLGDGRFEDATEAAGLGDRGFGCGLAVGDIDNDGDTDLYVTNFGRNTLYENLGNGTFRDITEAAGVGGTYWSTSAAFADLDGDGLLDLYVANYLLYDPRVHEACRGNAKKLPAYCHPNKYDGAPDSLYLNRGGGRFEDISRQAGVAVQGRILSKGLGLLPTDYDRDGDVDLLVANDSTPNFLWRNLGKGRFEDAALEAGVALNTSGQAEACMGIDSGDVDGDGLDDVYITNFSEETDTLYLGEGDGFFEDATFRSGLGKPTYLPLGFGTRLFDFDLDGDLDIYVARGHIMDNLQEIYPKTQIRHAQPDQLFVGDGKGRFVDRSASAGAWFGEARVGRAVATADFDSDGDLDLLVVNCGGRTALLENHSADAGVHHWIGLRLVGRGRVARDAYGAIVQVGAVGSLPAREFEVRSCSSYAAAADARLLIGLGRETTVPSVTVRWSDGRRERFTGISIDRYHTLTSGGGETP